jgi:hypothetical protein
LRERGDLRLTDFLAELTGNCPRAGTPRSAIDARLGSKCEVTADDEELLIWGWVAATSR